VHRLSKIGVKFSKRNRFDEINEKYFELNLKYSNSKGITSLSNLGKLVTELLILKLDEYFYNGIREEVGNISKNMGKISHPNMWFAK